MSRTWDELTKEEQNYLLAKKAEEEGRYAEAAVYYEKAGYISKANTCYFASLIVKPTEG